MTTTHREAAAVMMVYVDAAVTTAHHVMTERLNKRESPNVEDDVASMRTLCGG